jgi:hypothetical protein
MFESKGINNNESLLNSSKGGDLSKNTQITVSSDGEGQFDTFEVENKKNLVRETFQTSDDEDKDIIETKEVGEYEVHQQNRNILSRMFGKIEPGSLRGSVFAMISVALGTGILGLPKVFGVMSVLFGSIFLIFSGFNFLVNVYFVAIVAHKERIYDYSNLLKKVLGDFYAKVLNYGSLVFLYGACICYQVIIYRVVCTVIFDFFYTGDMQLTEYLEKGEMTKFGYKWGISFGIAALLLFPLSLMKNLSAFRVISIVGILSIFYLVLVSKITLNNNFMIYTLH